jgi:hypothetical protein
MLSQLTALASSSLHFQRGHLSACTFLDKESVAIRDTCVWQRSCDQPRHHPQCTLGVQRYEHEADSISTGLILLPVRLPSGPECLWDIEHTIDGQRSRTEQLRSCRQDTHQTGSRNSSRSAGRLADVSW